MNNRSCFCLVTHKYDCYIQHQWEKMKEDLKDTGIDCYLLYDNTQIDAKKDHIHIQGGIEGGVFSQEQVFVFDERMVRDFLEPLGYKLYYYEGIQNLFYGNIMAAFMMFFLEHNDYDYYWFKEWDVAYTGDWKPFFEKYDNIDDDYISRSKPILGTYNFHWWHHNQWKLTTLDPFLSNELLCTFNPIMRLSKAALNRLDEVYREGNSGFYEVFLATLLGREGFKLGGFRENGDLELNTFTYKKNESLYFSSIPMKKSQLYHPIKYDMYPDINSEENWENIKKDYMKKSNPLWQRYEFEHRRNMET